VFQLRDAARFLSDLELKVALRDGGALIIRARQHRARQHNDVVSRGGAAERVKCSG
jgi:hypothetical protein